MKTIEEGKTITRNEFEEISKGMGDGEIERCIWWVLDDGIENTNAATIAVDALNAYAALKARAENAEAAYIDLEKDFEKLEAERDALKAEMDSEVEEFNSGYSAFERGEPIENEYLYDHKHDVWSTGWVWAQHVKAGAK